ADRASSSATPSILPGLYPFACKASSTAIISFSDNSGVLGPKNIASSTSSSSRRSSDEWYIPGKWLSKGPGGFAVISQHLKWLVTHLQQATRCPKHHRRLPRSE